MKIVVATLTLTVWVIFPSLVLADWSVNSRKDSMTGLIRALTPYGSIKSLGKIWK